MNSWEKIPIGEIFSLEKGSLQSTKCTPGDYTFITASSEWKTHNEYSHDCEALVYAVAASGSLGRCHHYSGKFISSDLCFILRAKDEKKRPINYRFYQNVFRFLKDDIVAKTKAGTSKESISQKRFSAYRLPYIDIEHQLYWENKLNNLNDEIENIEGESTNQSSYLAKLRQAILQEAIEGKLTADWRKENPVRKGDPDYDSEALLVKIQAEKEKLIKEGKIKKQKPLAPIKAEEVPFELPEGWVWTRFANVIDIESNLVQPREYDDFIQIAPDDIEKGTGHLIGERKTVKEKMIISGNHLFFAGMLLYSKVRPRLRKIAAVDFEGLCSADMYPLKPWINNTYTLNIMLSDYFDEEVYKADNRVKMPKINQNQLSTILIPVPPHAEQKAIVERVEKLLSMVNELENQVSERKEQSEQLMQAVLREAFEGGK